MTKDAFLQLLTKQVSPIKTDLNYTLSSSFLAYARNVKKNIELEFMGK